MTNRSLEEFTREDQSKKTRLPVTHPCCHAEHDLRLLVELIRINGSVTRKLNSGSSREGNVKAQRRGLFASAAASCSASLGNASRA